MSEYKIILLMLVTLLMAVGNAEKINNTNKNLSVDYKDEDLRSTDVSTGRKKHHYLLYGGSALLGLGGLNALAVLYAIKVKIIVVGFIIALSVYYYSKIICQQSEIIRETNPFDSFSRYGPGAYSSGFRPGLDFTPHRFSFDHNDHHYHKSIPDFMNGSKFGKSSSSLSSEPLPIPSPTTTEKMLIEVYDQMNEFTPLIEK